MSMAAHTLRRELPDIDGDVAAFEASVRERRDLPMADQERHLIEATARLADNEVWRQREETRARCSHLDQATTDDASGLVDFGSLRYLYPYWPTPARETPPSMEQKTTEKKEEDTLTAVARHLCMHLEMFHRLDSLGVGMAVVQAKLAKILSLAETAREILEERLSRSIDGRDPLDTLDLLGEKVEKGELSQEQFRAAVENLGSRLTPADDRRLQRQEEFHMLGGQVRLTESVPEAIVQVQRAAGALLDEFDSPERIALVTELNEAFAPWLVWPDTTFTVRSGIGPLFYRYRDYHRWLEQRIPQWFDQGKMRDGYVYAVYERKIGEMWLMWERCARAIHAHCERYGYDRNTKECLPSFCKIIGVRNLGA